jgi:hypothetical protein
MRPPEPLALMIVQELERLRQDIAEMTQLVPSPRERAPARAREVVGAQIAAARSPAPRRKRA